MYKAVRALAGAALLTLAAAAPPATAQATDSKMTDKVGLYITFWAAPGKQAELLEAVQAILPTAQAEAGTLVYAIQLARDGDRSGVSVYEVYADAGAQKAHGESQAIAALRTALPALVSGPPEARHFTPLPGAKGLR